ncbi:putative MFS family arabinose efflux permease [Nocardioides aromaticivorans]|uniref:Putative MFS family arabinose efflux permease n=1 Tax=Nocardioides aromaticivorans TaxID=200618 RepID=A0A7Y9ZH04_9ACTN|nr:MFS transporter [Nocardioides aromaticivorans]NYI45294.1 putative MFS family arabinose efflux permease [Nocardioides aromaticivorans]
MAEAGADRPGAGAALRVRAFRLLLSVQLVNAVAVWVHVVGVQWLLTERGEPATVVALAPAAMALPFILLALPVGVVVSHAARERLLVRAAVASTLASLAAAGLVATGADGAVPLLLTVLVVGGALVVVGVSWQSMVPELVERALVPAAVLLDGAVFNMARAVGPLLAGIVLGLAGPLQLFAAISAMFAACVALLLLAGTPTATRPGRTESVPAAMRGALWFVRHSPWTTGLLVRMIAFGLPASALWALVSLAVHDRLELGSAGFGATMAVLGAGSVAAALTLGPVRERVRVHTFVAVLAGGYALTLAALGSLDALGVLVPFLVLGGVGWVAVQSTWMMLAHQALPEWVRPRVVALLLMLFQGTQAVGALLWGAVADVLGVGPALLVAAAVLAAYSVVLLGVGMRSSAGIEPLLATPDPAVEALVGEAGEGELLVRHEYVVAAAARDDFRRAIDALRLSRLRTGARSWEVVPDPERPGTWLETYLVRDRDLLREQETSRLTVPELRLRDAVRSTTTRSAGPTLILAPPAEPHRRPASRRRRGGRA